MSTENDRSQQFWKEPPQETSYEAHLRRKRLKQQQKARPAKSQVPNEEQDSVVEAEDVGTHDQTNRPQRTTPRTQPSSAPRPRSYSSSGTRLPEGYSRENYETESPSAPSRRRLRLPEDYREEDYEIETDLPRELPRQRMRPINDRDPRRGRLAPTADVSAKDRRTPGKTTRHLPQARQRRAWPWMLAGCAGGILTIAVIVAIVLVIFFRTTLGGALFGGVFNQTFTRKNPTQVFPYSNFAQIKVDNNLGSSTTNVTIVVDQSATVTTLTSVTKVPAANMDAANKEFARLPLTINNGQQPPVNPAMPTLFLSICGQSNTACGNTNDIVDITITLPASTNPNGSYFIDVETRNGNVSLQLAQGTQLAVGSCLSTGNGNVTFKGTLDTTNGNNLIPCSQNMTTNPHPWYTFHSEIGNLDVTQIPVTKNVLLDASVTSGKINSDGFNLNIEVINRSLAYHGPLFSGTSPPAAELKLDVGSGDINLHRI